VTDEAIAGWQAAPRPTPGGQSCYSGLAIETCLMLRLAFHLPLRQTEGLMASVFDLIGASATAEVGAPRNRQVQSAGAGQNQTVAMSAPSQKETLQMPNCDFYATPQDQTPLLDWIFAEGACKVFELSSQFDTPLKEFHSAQDVLSEFGRVYSNGALWHTVHLQLYVIGASPPFVPTRVELNPKFCDGATFRYAAEGWGLVQLYLTAPTANGLNSSHTNHFTAKGAEKWAPLSSEKGPAEQWDFKKIAAFSSRLNREIKKLSVAKIGSRAILPCALDIWQAGVPLLPFNQTNGNVVLHS
jgi:hypothetical protein